MCMVKTHINRISSIFTLFTLAYFTHIESKYEIIIYMYVYAFNGFYIPPMCVSLTICGFLMSFITK